jgi:hypothetical protein
MPMGIMWKYRRLLIPRRLQIPRQGEPKRKSALGASGSKGSLRSGGKRVIPLI